MAEFAQMAINSSVNRKTLEGNKDSAQSPQKIERQKALPCLCQTALHQEKYPLHADDKLDDLLFPFIP